MSNMEVEKDMSAGSNEESEECMGASRPGNC